MAEDYWDSTVRRYGYYEEDEESETVGRVVREDGRALSVEEAEEREREARERAVFDAEQGRLQKLVESKRALVIDMRKLKSQRGERERLGQPREPQYAEEHGQGMSERRRSW